ncbi:PucR family transcriptional regulator ligand-binding domain-containing protein [Lachnospiraceae bacterium NSJ-143]|nr:PucR family transcriptional regulator ligand-binding domain-containing protein [Lachnospiraceae bacterium NSJ-143]
MSATVEKIFSSLSSSYKVKCVAGNAGRENYVEWVSVVEDDLRLVITNEIIFTSGIKNSYDGYLLELARKIYEFNCSALALKLGPYIRSVPQEVIDYCNEVSLPLFTIPPQGAMVEIVRDICHHIIYEETYQSNISETMQNIIFNTENLQSQINKLEKAGYSRESIYCPVIIEIERNERDDYEILTKDMQIYCERLINESGSLYVSFMYNRYLILIFIDCANKIIDSFVREFYLNQSLKFAGHKIYISVGPNRDNIFSIAKNFKRTLSITKPARKSGQKVTYYDFMGIYKLISEIEDISILKEFHDSALGSLIRFDTENGTDLLSFLETYLNCNGNVQEVAQKRYVHRNTVNNQIKKIEKITGIDPLTISGKVQFAIAFEIKDLLES